MSSTDPAELQLLADALRSARDTKLLELGRGARLQAGEAFAALFGGAAALVVADDNTMAAAGVDVCDALKSTGQAQLDPLILAANGLYAEYTVVNRIREHLEKSDAIPIAVGSGTINDMVKLAAHQCGRSYLAVATAASMDGYTAYGASITYQGSKQTFDCPAPRGVVADLDVIAAAPEGMNAAGYADLAAKITAGADWIVADFLGVEPIDALAWHTVQSRLRYWLDEPDGVRQRNVESLQRITIALMMSGFAMQSSLSSRPASGAEHQFSHLWDMERHSYQGQAPSHGFKVGIGSLASLALYEALDDQNISELDVDAAVAAWPDAAANEREIAALFTQDDLAARAREESRAKLVEPEVLRDQLEGLKRGWLELQRRLRTQLIPRSEFRDMLRLAGAPYSSDQIGVSAERLRRSYHQTFHIRRRFTVLDVARRTGLMEPCLEHIFCAANEPCGA